MFSEEELHHLVRDEFNQRHIIVVSTKAHKLFGIESTSGKVGVISFQEYCVT